MEKREIASEYHQKGYNCAQAVVCSFCEDIDMDKKSLFKLSEGFGLGMGSMQCTCGALSGAIFLAGIKNSSGNLENPSSKQSTYQIAKDIQEKFKERIGSTVCQEIKGVNSGKMLSSCAKCIDVAVQIAEEVLFSK
ncbi:MAG: C-GCAxxG-C-C family protein [Clostridium sp.]|nr:C-GCAxxG-C-C family protein [Clostridium sp.]